MVLFVLAPTYSFAIILSLAQNFTMLRTTSTYTFKSYLLICWLLLGLLSACSQPLKKRQVLVIGDSNGAADKGWVFQFQQLRKGGPLVNTAVSGNTIGFDGMGSDQLNTISQLSRYLRRGYAEMGGIHEIIISLGTNDCKKQYEGLNAERHVNYRRLLTEINTFFTARGQSLPRIVLLSPPPAAEDAQLNEEFHGAAACISELADFLAELAAEKGYCYVNLLEKPGASLLNFSEDGIHFNANGYELIARQLIKKCY